MLLILPVNPSSSWFPKQLGLLPHEFDHMNCQILVLLLSLSVFKICLWFVLVCYVTLMNPQRRSISHPMVPCIVPSLLSLLFSHSLVPLNILSVECGCIHWKCLILFSTHLLLLHVPIWPRPVRCPVFLALLECIQLVIDEWFWFYPHEEYVVTLHTGVDSLLHLVQSLFTKWISFQLSFANSNVYLAVTSGWKYHRYFVG